MKIYGILCVIVASILLLAPLTAISFGKSTGGEESSSESDEVLSEIEKAEKNDDSKDTISVFCSADGQVIDLSMRDYVIGSVAAEMPAAYDIEALKVQAIASVTFGEYMKIKEKKSPDEALKGADLSDDSKQHQGYMSVDDMKTKWGDGFETYYNKIAEAVDAVISKEITYKGEPIMAAYHAISSGKTESAKNIWGQDIPYLQSVDSEDDNLSPQYSVTTAFSESEFKDIAKKIDGADLSGEASSWIKITDKTSAGTVSKVKIGGKSVSGLDTRSYFGLRSPVFKVEYKDGYFTFTTYGYGHGVGMSQYGADCLAKNGMKYDEIIKHYYTGVEITDRK